jgi:pilus assembly protein FimV
VPVIEEPGLLAGLMEDPLIPLGGAAGLALLAGGAFFIRQRKKKGAQVDSSFLESRLQPDSFFGASGGQRVDTNNEGPVSGSSMVYSASQLDAADDVDPVAEADVYLAYGRDMQAEEILKEALRTSPGRLAIHTKLLEIYAKRRDTENFEASAHQAFKLTGVQSAGWTRICEMGMGIDPANTLYQPGGSALPSMDDDGPGSEARSSFGASTAPQSISAEMPAAAPAVDLDLDLDFSLDDEPASAISDVTGGTVNADSINQTIKMQTAEPDALGGLDFDVSAPASLESTPELPEISLSMDGVSLTSAEAPALPEFDATNTMTIEPSTAATPISNEGMLEFDMDSLSLDLEPPAQEEPAPAPETTGEDPLETKLALAEEFISIGDEDGARALIEEVVAEATGDMRIKAQRALANLS